MLPSSELRHGSDHSAHCPGLRSLSPGDGCALAHNTRCCSGTGTYINRDGVGCTGRLCWCAGVPLLTVSTHLMLQPATAWCCVCCAWQVSLIALAAAQLLVGLLALLRAGLQSSCRTSRRRRDVWRGDGSSSSGSGRGSGRGSGGRGSPWMACSFACCCCCLRWFTASEEQLRAPSTAAALSGPSPTLTVGAARSKRRSKQRGSSSSAWRDARSSDHHDNTHDVPYQVEVGLACARRAIVRRC